MTAPPDRRVFQNWLLILAGVFVIAWAVVRASVQSITFDEAFTYLHFASQPLPTVWQPSSNNHVLNSLLMWIATHAFGTSNITVRMPALLGAVLYVCVSYFLCKSLTNRLSLRLPLFICLTCNPFILDFMVAARGYSLANAFLLAAIAVPVWHRMKGRPSLRTSCVVASLALGLSFAANFAFVFVDTAAFLALLIWAIRRREGESIARIAGFCALPGLAAALLLCGYPLAHWPEEQWWGAHSLTEMRQSLVQSSFYQVDPRLPGAFHKAANFLPLVPLLAVLCACQLVATRLGGAWLGRLAAALAGIVTLSAGMSWLAFRFYDLPLPLGRTGIYLVPLCTLLAAIIAAAPDQNRVSQWLRRGIAGVFICMACYFLLCLRLSYFREYKWNADVKEVYSVLARLNHTYGVTDAQATGLYVSSLNYYRALSRRETFPEFLLQNPELSAGNSVYVVDRVLAREFIDKEKLAVVYRGKFSEVVVAVQPDGPIPPVMIEP